MDPKFEFDPFVPALTPSGFRFEIKAEAGVWEEDADVEGGEGIDVDVFGGGAAVADRTTGLRRRSTPPIATGWHQFNQEDVDGERGEVMWMSLVATSPSSNDGFAVVIDSFGRDETPNDESSSSSDERTIKGGGGGFFRPTYKAQWMEAFFDFSRPSLYLRLYLSVLLPRIPTIFCSKALKKNGDDQPEEGKHAAPAGGEPGAVRAGPAVQHNQRGDVRHIRQIRIGTSKDTRGTAFVVYEDIYDAKTAVDHLSGFNVANRYLIVLYYQQAKMSKKFDQCKKDEELTKLQEKYGVSTKDNWNYQKETIDESQCSMGKNMSEFNRAFRSLLVGLAILVFPQTLVAMPLQLSWPQQEVSGQPETAAL
ncbi:hypothetical protein RJ640_016021 [Escallonia rubra]|uniref:RRM domain-containing protein n=1 Tax=Escallonia rubra TaxID=112253 RepID=A0AA88R9F0_9ASTE|nr:hypothetical protein RJ640_016021 [Escallonia rubra]